MVVGASWLKPTKKWKQESISTTINLQPEYLTLARKRLAEGFHEYEIFRMTNDK